VKLLEHGWGSPAAKKTTNTTLHRYCGLIDAVGPLPGAPAIVNATTFRRASSAPARCEVRRTVCTGHPRQTHLVGLHHPTMSISGPTQKPAPLDRFDLRLARMPPYMTTKCLLFVSSRAQSSGLDTDSGKIGGRPVLARDAGCLLDWRAQSTK
jgi:hypothetical protein